VTDKTPLYVMTD